ncbi:ATP-dependent exoDNAse (exonuclease V) beta subunit (contains helicase and exonuclease domains) [Mariniphaga anaerophila]|uniref:DNA 3'-5' helicase n=1 Tax=Mariniphaga anaerophila TaxID=1484053 RepID=A0A1M4XZC3_9BACT|nr:UvrD-helicase domain-containing protein [Mariniphaga anaerophila]SHE98582.1 ATP-dependent exoDNAse (exonuclease V) beta subunit (contains helicase and exonuclease domains) [Mariniphaga anaerophila]
MLTVYKASAGSGKTFQLVAEYLMLLLKNPVSYRNILAVTFTNKATQEMKNRILEQLYQLAANKNSPYLELLQGVTSLSEEITRKRARLVLKNILHDYNRFAVNTIDSFTQRVIKAFNREMGISPNFVLELDNEMILEEAVDQLMAKVDQDKKLRKWLVKFSEEKIRENKSQRIEEDIKSLGKELFKEKFQVFFPENENDENPYTRENLDAFRNELEKIVVWYENSVKQMASDCINSIEKSGFSVDDFSHKMNGVAGYLKKLSGGDFKEPGIRALAAAESAEKWFPKTHEHKNALLQLVETKLLPQLGNILQFFSDNEIRYQSAVEVRKQLRMLGILTDLKEEVKLLLKEKGILQLSDSNLLLSKIIGESDSPFIYEKVGSRFNYFMLDEFQDTSSLQWNNFKPLVSNALSEGHSALLVGDVKQSIYRWRNSDWNILASQISSDFPHYPLREIPLDKNWRSQINVIHFNNAVIGALKQTFEDFLFDEIEDASFRDKFSGIYRYFKQEPGNPGAEKKGLAEVNFLPEEDFEEASLELLVEQVKQLQDRGVKASETAILIRKNKEGAKIIETFLEASKREENAGYNLSVLSNESLFLFASRGVTMVMLVVELLIDANAKIQKVALLHLWLSWLKPALKKMGHAFSDKPQLTLDFSNTGEESDSDWSIDENFEPVFETELGGKMKQLREKVLLSSLDETVTEVCVLFGLFKMESELPFLQTLIDQAANLKISLSNDLSNFLLWWNEKGYDTSVNVNEKIDSVRLLTVHKAKGLEYEAVLLPFFNWDVSWTGTLAPTLWCRPGAEPFNRFPLLPVKAGSKLSKTIFRDDFFEEKVSSFIDTFNLVYVAFTRAKAALFINCKQKPEKASPGKNSGPGKSVNALLEYALNQMAADDEFAGCWNEGKNVFRFGEIPFFEAKEVASQSGWIKNYRFDDFAERISLRITSEDFLAVEEHSRSVKNTGKLVHEILAEVITEDDFEPACTKAFKEGKINEEEREFILEKLRDSMENPLIKKWFSSGFDVLNERNLLTSGKLLRPDRILVSGKQAVVVDYKWGEKNQKKYHSQVKSYAENLKKCGFEKVEGFLWYINQDEVEKVI